MPTKKMSPEDAARIQSHADKTGTNQDFKERARSAAAHPEKPPTPQGGPPKDKKQRG